MAHPDCPLHDCPYDPRIRDLETSRAAFDARFNTRFDDIDRRFDEVRRDQQEMLATLKDAAMAADIERLQINYDPIPGEETAKMFADFYNTPPALVQKARQYTLPDQK